MLINIYNRLLYFFTIYNNPLLITVRLVPSPRKHFHRSSRCFTPNTLRRLTLLLATPSFPLSQFLHPGFHARLSRSLKSPNHLHKVLQVVVVHRLDQLLLPLCLLYHLE
jgi:hypothetical protein